MTLTDVGRRGSTASTTHSGQESKDSPRDPFGWMSRNREARRRWELRAGLAIVLVIVAVFHGRNLVGWPLLDNDDEGTYYAQAWAVLNKGELAHYTYWYDHPPLGWLQLALFLEPLQWVAGSLPTVVGGRMVMVLYTVISAALLYQLARNLGLRPVLALATPLLWALSPLVGYEGRQVFLDNMQMPWLIASFVLASDRQCRLPLHMASGLCFAAAVLTKETAVLAAPAVVLLLWRSAYPPTRTFAVVGWLASAFLAGMVYPLYALLRSELIPGAGHVSLLDAVIWQLSAREGSGFILIPGTAAHGMVSFWLNHDKVLILGGLAAAVICLVVSRLRPIAVLVLVYFLFMGRPSGYLPAMMIITVLPFAALLMTGLLDETLNATHKLPRRGGRLTRVVMVFAAGAALYHATAPWPGQWREAHTADLNGPYVEALQYVTDNINRDTTIVTSDVAWNDLVRAGWAGDGFTGAIWFYKLDRDEEADVFLPQGWRDIDYLIIGPGMRQLIESRTVDAESDPNVIAALRNSVSVKRWGSGPGQVDLRAVVDPEAP